MVEMELEVDSQVYREFCGLCERRGLVPEEVTHQFFHWVASHPEEAKAWLRQAAAEGEGTCDDGILRYQYRDIRRFEGVGSAMEFYSRLGLASCLGSEEIPSVSRLWINPRDHRALWELVRQENLRRHRGLREPAATSGAMVEFLDLSPRQED